MTVYTEYWTFPFGAPEAGTPILTLVDTWVQEWAAYAAEHGIGDRENLQGFLVIPHYQIGLGWLEICGVTEMGDAP